MLTKIDIDALEAGPELDARIAEIMGLWLQELTHRPSKELHWVGPHPTIEGTYAYASAVIGGHLNWQSFWGNGLPRFSADIAAAFLVVGHLAKQGIAFHVSNYGIVSAATIENDMWSPALYVGLNALPDTRTVAERVALVLCKAALLAKQATTKE